MPWCDQLKGYCRPRTGMSPPNNARQKYGNAAPFWYNYFTQ